MSQKKTDKGKASDRPLTKEEYGGLAPGDPFNETDRIAAGKKLCGLCGHKVRDKGWRCSQLNLWAGGPGIPTLTCPVPDPMVGCPGFLKKPSAIRPPQPKKKGLPVPPGVTFLYFGRPKSGSRGHKGVVTMATITPEPGVLHLGFSFCSPKDPWCKVTGRDMALARLLHPVVVPYLYSPKRTAREVARAVMTHDFKRLAALTPGATMWGSVPSWTKDLANWIKADERMARLVARVKRHVSGIFTRRREGKSLADKLLAHKAAPGSPIDWQRHLQGSAPGPFPSSYFTDEAAVVPPEAMALLDKVVRRRMRHQHPLSIARLSKLFGPPLEVEIPLKVVARMMADMANLGG